MTSRKRGLSSNGKSCARGVVVDLFDFGGGGSAGSDWPTGQSVG